MNIPKKHPGHAKVKGYIALYGDDFKFIYQLFGESYIKLFVFFFLGAHCYIPSIFLLQ